MRAPGDQGLEIAFPIGHVVARETSPSRICHAGHERASARRYRWRQSEIGSAERAHRAAPSPSNMAPRRSNRAGSTIAGIRRRARAAIPPARSERARQTLPRSRKNHVSGMTIALNQRLQLGVGSRELVPGTCACHSTPQARCRSCTARSKRRRANRGDIEPHRLLEQPVEIVERCHGLGCVLEQ